MSSYFRNRAPIAVTKYVAVIVKIEY